MEWHVNLMIIQRKNLVLDQECTMNKTSFQFNELCTGCKLSHYLIEERAGVLNLKFAVAKLSGLVHELMRSIPPISRCNQTNDTSLLSPLPSRLEWWHTFSYIYG